MDLLGDVSNAVAIPDLSPPAKPVGAVDLLDLLGDVAAVAGDNANISRKLT